MYYHNTKYTFPLPGLSPKGIAGGVISASAMIKGQLFRRNIEKQKYLLNRLFDPQMYLAGLDPQLAEKSVTKLASWPWFQRGSVPDYDSDKHLSLEKWKKEYKPALLKNWARRPPTEEREIRAAVKRAVEEQTNLGCQAIILPSPLTNVVAQNYETETLWLDAGVDVCQELGIEVPVYATVALSDNLLRGIAPLAHPLLHTITGQIAARENIAGAYVVIEQANEEGYVCTSGDTVLSLLVLADDLVRGAGRKVIVNYLGTLGLLASAIGATIWVSGYYLSQRRLKLVDYEDRKGLAYPRFLSPTLAGDVGLENDAVQIQRVGLGKTIFCQTAASENLLRALNAGVGPEKVPDWKYARSNITAAAGHYNEVCFTLDSIISELSEKEKIEWVHHWLQVATEIADQLQGFGISRGPYTEMVHQRTWLTAFESWMKYAGY